MAVVHHYLFVNSVADVKGKTQKCSLPVLRTPDSASVDTAAEFAMLMYNCVVVRLFRYETPWVMELVALCLETWRLVGPLLLRYSMECLYYVKLTLRTDIVFPAAAA